MGVNGWTKRPVIIELAMLRCLVTKKVSFSSGVAPRSVTLLPVAMEPITTSLS